ncbi:MAG: site-specific integrase [Desulfobacteraceae bacterium]|nr:site-specific integrase [Desulfobacteraceae bacterium]MBC2751334.1 tyrosine-type recombinase/integrase [Desulfobacteraceae bacterium]
MTILTAHFPMQPSRVKNGLDLISDDMRRYVAERREATRTVIDRTSIKKTKKGGRKQQGRRIKKPISDATISRELTDVKAILNWAVAQDPPLISYNPVRDFKKPRPERVDIRPPSIAETRAILKAAPPHLVRFIKLSYYLGVRPGAVELLRLTWDAVNWDTGSIEVISAEKGGMVRRHVPIHDGFAAELETWWKQDKKTGPIIQYNKKPVKRIQTTWENTLTRAKLKRRLRPYDLRHNFITAALEEGADIGAVAAIVGSSPETLRRHYQHVTNRLRRHTVALIKPLEESN